MLCFTSRISRPTFRTELYARLRIRLFFRLLVRIIPAVLSISGPVIFPADTYAPNLPFPHKHRTPHYEVVKLSCGHLRARSSFFFFFFSNYSFYYHSHGFSRGFHSPRGKAYFPVLLHHVRSNTRDVAYA